MALFRLFWMPYWRSLNAGGMYVHDVEATFLIMIGPLIPGVTFFAIVLVLELVERQRLALAKPPIQPATVAVVLSLLPVAVVYGLLNRGYPAIWHYPLAEVSAGFAGLGLSFLWRRW